MDYSVDAIVLAGGLSRRMGEPKLLLQWGATTILGQTLKNVLASQVGDIVMVTGGYAQQTQAIAEQNHIRWVHNRDYSTKEMISSLQVGLGALRNSADFALVMLADMPLIEPELLDTLITASQSGIQGIFVPQFEQKSGHPILFHRRFFYELMAVTPPQSPRTVLQQNDFAVTYVPVNSPSIYIDIDHREAYERWRPR